MSEIDNSISGPTSCPFHFWRKHRHEKLSDPDPRIEMAADAPTSGDWSMASKTLPFPRGRAHIRGQLVHQRSERHYLARQKISLEQIARVSSLHCSAEKSRRNI